MFDSFKNLFAPKGPTLQVVNIEKRFELLGRVGQGSMSKVYRARDRKLGRQVCLKLLDKEKTAKFEARFVGLKKPAEGEICMQMSHQNIVKTFEHGITTTKEPYLVMEFVEGTGLNFLIETKNPALDGKRVEYLAQLADGLEYLHKKGFLHRDLCPRNIMVSKEGVVKIIDMGLTIPYMPDFCKPGNRTGTTNYLAPELINRKTTDHRVDLFALGVTAYEVFTGDTPWEKGTSEQVLRRIVNSPPRDPRELRTDLETSTAKFLIKAVERDPAKRFQRPAEFREALLRLA
jgi:eukaryotic-like serine/threonine-protein kinase